MTISFPFFYWRCPKSCLLKFVFHGICSIDQAQINDWFSLYFSSLLMVPIDRSVVAVETGHMHIVAGLPKCKTYLIFNNKKFSQTGFENLVEISSASKMSYVNFNIFVDGMEIETWKFLDNTKTNLIITEIKKCKSFWFPKPLYNNFQLYIQHFGS